MSNSKIMVYRYPGSHKIAKDFYVSHKVVDVDDLEKTLEDGWHSTPDEAKDAFLSTPDETKDAVFFKAEAEVEAKKANIVKPKAK